MKRMYFYGKETRIVRKKSFILKFGIISITLILISDINNFSEMEKKLNL